MSETIESLTEKMKYVRNAMKNDGKRLVADLLREKWPKEVAAVRWRQYTPSFNDGDPCVFRCCADDAQVRLIGGGEEDGEGSDGFLYSYELENGQFGDFLDALARVPEDLFEAAFGNDVQITASRTEAGGVEFDSEEYYR